jgi:hypothetical protein
MNEGDQSHTAKLVLDGSCSCNAVFLKRIVTSDMKDRTLTKWTADIASYQNEALFYKHIAPLLIARNIKIPKPLFVHVEPPVNDGTIEGLRQAKSLLLLEHFGEPYRQHSPLSKDEAFASLRFLAKLHGSCMEDAQVLRPASLFLFSEACYWKLQKRGESSLKCIQPIWSKFIENFTPCDPTLFCTPGVQNLANRMVAMAHWIDKQLRVEADGQFCTIVHGDFKVSSLLLCSRPRATPR